MAGSAATLGQVLEAQSAGETLAAHAMLAAQLKDTRSAGLYGWTNMSALGGLMKEILEKGPLQEAMAKVPALAALADLFSREGGCVVWDSAREPGILRARVEWREAAPLGIINALARVLRQAQGLPDAKEEW